MTAFVDRAYIVECFECGHEERFVFGSEAEAAAVQHDKENHGRPYTHAHTRHWCGHEGCRDS